MYTQEGKKQNKLDRAVLKLNMNPSMLFSNDSWRIRLKLQQEISLYFRSGVQ